MRMPEVRSIVAATRLMCAIVMLTSLTMLTPAYATLYTFTSPAFTDISPSNSPAPPGIGIGDVLTISFTYDGALPTKQGGTGWLANFVMSAGKVTLAAADGTGGFADIYAVDPVTGVPSFWDFNIVEAGYTLFSRFRPEPPTVGYGWAAYGVGNDRVYVGYYGHPGVWVATPLPGTLLLLGSGLIPLAWARRKKRLGQ
jgi:hypothetical protein